MVEVIWIDEARARQQIRLLGLIASFLGWDGFDDLTDPADIFTEPDLPAGPERASDPAERAAQITLFMTMNPP
jgi:hypothetical protein